tara:strand:- start:237 stop:542 length:306 start_codon:yes stop_codon:yes gene_type:complete
MKKGLKKKKEPTQRKNISTKLLVKRALKNKPVWKPAPGFKYIKDVDIGELIITTFKTKAVLISKDTGSASVIVTDCNICEEDKQSYLGKKLWSLQTQVKIR